MDREHITTMEFSGGAKIKGGAKTFAISFDLVDGSLEVQLIVGKKQHAMISSTVYVLQQETGECRDLQFSAQENKGKMDISLTGNLDEFFRVMKTHGIISDEVIDAVLTDEFYNLPQLIADTSSSSKSNTPSSASTADNPSPRGLTHR